MEKQISSGLRITFLIHFYVALVFGLIYFLVPQFYGAVINWTVQDPAVFRLLGAAMLGIAFTSLLSYKNPVWEKVKIVVLMEIVWTVLGAIATVWGILFEGLPAIGWMNAVILAVFAFLFVLFYQREKD